ncbi:CASPASE_P20 domain-containing protein [Durusdinium trenchii]|uniref:CASPASE_P20 domain-containing protein n=1 Tax=Durusdinium trenchii TaxID=1381693 RepID=A0ABP0HTA0_9DINO
MASDERVLLTLGNDAYRSCGECSCRWTLKGAVNDSRGLRKHCQSDGWYVHSAQNIRTAEMIYHQAEQAGLGITRNTSVAVMHYSGHARNGWLIPCDQPCNCTGPKETLEHANLQKVLELFCANISREMMTQVIVFIDGCRVDEGQDISSCDPVTRPSTLSQKQLLLVYACNPSGRAFEHGNQDGSYNGRFSLALLESLDRCEKLSGLLAEVQKK